MPLIAVLNTLAVCKSCRGRPVLDVSAGGIFSISHLRGHDEIWEHINIEIYALAFGWKAIVTLGEGVINVKKALLEQSPWQL